MLLDETGALSDITDCSTIFRTLTEIRHLRDLAVHRIQRFICPNRRRKELPDYIAAALFNALQVNRKQTAFYRALPRSASTAPAVSRLREDEKPDMPDPEPEPTDDQSPQKKESRYKYAVLIVLSVFIFLLLLAGTVLLLIFPDLIGGGGETSSTTSSSAIQTTTSRATTEYVPQTEKFATPDLIGKSYYDIRNNKLGGKMKVEVEYKKYSSRPKGEILDQTPKPETPAEEGSTIKVIISAGSESITVPNVSGWHYEHAKLYLEALGFRVEIMRIVSDTFDIDIVKAFRKRANSLRKAAP